MVFDSNWSGSGSGSSSMSKRMFSRSDKVDFSKLDDVHLNAHLANHMSRKSEIQEEWEIGLEKLEIKDVILDHGKYGTLYKHAVYDGQDVAVKLLDWGENGLTTVSEAFALRALFQQEIAVWHKLDHPNVTKFIGASMGTWDDLNGPSDDVTSDTETTDSLASRVYCILVENLQGGTLKKYLIKNYRKKLSYKNVVQLALDLSRGLSYLHSKKIVHRDIKTENMLDKDGRLKIADFGVARVEARNPVDMTGATGTIGYRAPEVIAGKPYDKKCDVYSLAICLWEIYCCDMPYCGLNFADLCDAVVNKNLRPSIPKCCPRPYANILKKCWDPKPEKRPGMAEVVKMLEEIDTSKGGGMLPEDQVTGCFWVKPPRGP